MTFANPDGQSSFTASLTGLMGKIRTQWRASRTERRMRRRIAMELSGSSDRELGELGFSRADLPLIACGTYRR